MYLLKLDAIDSTNSYLRELSKNTLLEKWTVVSADYQSQGRGQKGAVWQSERGKNLICSILVKLDDFKVQDQFLLNCAVSVGIFNVLKRYKLPKLKIKWPNDIMSVSKKLGGILIENSLTNEQINQTIIGIGINVNQTDFAADLPTAGSIRQLTGENHKVHDLLLDIVESIKFQFENMAGSGHKELRAAYNRNLYRKNAAHMFCDARGRKFMGIIRGVNPMGMLEIENEDEKIEAFYFKEISYM